MQEIQVKKNVDKEELEEKNVFEWPIWEKEASEFPWSYDEKEVCYFLEGQVEVIPEEGEPVEMGKGDLVTFPKGMECTWRIKEDVKKHYKLG